MRSHQGAVKRGMGIAKDDPHRHLLKMLSLKDFILAGATCVMLITPSNAQEEKAVADKAAPIARQLACLHKILSAQTSLSLIALESGHVEPGFGHDALPDFTGTLKLLYKGNRFLYDVNFSGSTAYSQVESFDGEQYAHLNRNGGLLSISTKRFVNDVVMCQGHVFFMPFLFLESGFSADAFTQLSYVQLCNKDDWTHLSLSSTSGVEEVTLDDQTYLKIASIGKNIDPVSDKACVFNVFFSKRFNWYPMKWERRLLTGEIVTSYSVEELGSIKMENGGSIPYPQISVLKHYRDNALRDTERLEVQQISFGSVSDDDIAIDPASANFIRYLDTGVKIKVPK
jgi:hypothetical protein